MESVAETSEEFMDRYFEGDTFSITEVSAALAMNVQEASIVPVCMGSPINLRGVSTVSYTHLDQLPRPSENTMKTTDFLLMIRIGKHLLQQ